MSKRNSWAKMSPTQVSSVLPRGLPSPLILQPAYPGIIDISKFFTLPSSTHRSTNQWIKPDGKEAEHGKNPNRDFVAASTFRAGVLQLLTDATTITETAGVACVAKIKGDVNQVRKSVYYVWNPSHPVPTFLTYDLYLAYTSARTS